ncbi:MAG TPA: DUF3606 domain-containing protein [Burkholderiales bacterium]|nr:DUF3606 domain-containing protein [Burkholderiales bacterium]
MAALVCIECQQENRAAGKFCSQCGARLNLRLCAKCEAINDRSWLRCHNCGENLVAPSRVELAPKTPVPASVPLPPKPSATARLTVAIVLVATGLAGSALYFYRPPGDSVLTASSKQAASPSGPPAVLGTIAVTAPEATRASVAAAVTPPLEQTALPSEALPAPPAPAVALAMEAVAPAPERSEQTALPSAAPPALSMLTHAIDAPARALRAEATLAGATAATAPPPPARATERPAARTERSDARRSHTAARAEPPVALAAVPQVPKAAAGVQPVKQAAPPAAAPQQSLATPPNAPMPELTRAPPLPVTTVTPIVVLPAVPSPQLRPAAEESAGSAAPPDARQSLDGLASSLAQLQNAATLAALVDQLSQDGAPSGKADESRINIDREQDVQYWSKRLGVSEDDLRGAVKSVGPLVKDVMQKLRSERPVAAQREGLAP